jgi:hypothetical protein
MLNTSSGTCVQAHRETIDENVRLHGIMRRCIDALRWHRLCRSLERRERQGPMAWRLRLGDSDRKFKFRTADGCEVERKWKKGEYEEKVKCKPGRYGYGY